MSNHDEFVKTLRRAGHRVTPQREMVLSVLGECGGHVTAEQVLARVRERYPYLNKSAVYRSLDLLADLSLVTVTDLGQGRVEYELHDHPHHHHLICRSCGKIAQVDNSCFSALEKGLRQNYGFEADLTHFAVFGRCRACSKKERK